MVDADAAVALRVGSAACWTSLLHQLLTVGCSAIVMHTTMMGYRKKKKMRAMCEGRTFLVTKTTIGETVQSLAVVASCPERSNMSK